MTKKLEKNKARGLLILALTSLLSASVTHAENLPTLNGSKDRAVGLSNQEIWNQKFSDLGKEIKTAFAEANKTGNFTFEDNKVPVAWSVSAAGTVRAYSLYSGYFYYLRENGRKVFNFTETDIPSQSINIEAGNNLIISPTSKFGDALNVGTDFSARLHADNSIVFNPPDTNGLLSNPNAWSISTGEGAKAEISAKTIILHSGLWGLANSSTSITAREGIYFVLPPETQKNSLNTVVWVTNSLLKMDAPEVIVRRDLVVGGLVFEFNQPSLLQIGQENVDANTTNNVEITGSVKVQYGSHLKVFANESVIFNGITTVDDKSVLLVSSKNVQFDELNVKSKELGDETATFNITDGGRLVFKKQASAVGDGAILNINLGQSAGMEGSLFKDQSGQINVNLNSGAYWRPFAASNVTNLTVKPLSFIQLGESGQKFSINVDNLIGDGAVFYLPDRANTSLNISSASEGFHHILLSSTGSSFRGTQYLYHIVVNDGSPRNSRNAEFGLTNNGIVDAGPYEYRLHLFPFRNENDKVWAILGEQGLKPSPDEPSNPEHPENPDNPDEPSNPEHPENPDNPDELPDLPFDPSNPPSIDDLPPIKPIGLSPTGKLVLASTASAIQAVEFLGTTDQLRSRMGEIRNGADSGAYVLYRFDRSRFKPYSSLTSKFTHNSFKFGFDRKITPQWILGANLSAGEGKIKLSSVSGCQTRTSSIGLTAYATWFNEAGSFLDAVLSVNRHKYKLHAKMLDEESAGADYHSFGFGLSLEAGHQFSLPTASKKQEWFVEPQIQLAYYFSKGKDFQVDNGMNVKVKNADSLNGRLGLAAGRKFFNEKGQSIGQVYLRGGIMHEFLGKSRVHMNEYSFRTHSLGTRAYYGIGGEAVISQKVKFFGQINRESGARIKTDFQFKAGLKIIF